MLSGLKGDEYPMKEGAQIYKTHKVHVFLSKFISENLGTIYPIFDLKHGYRYPDVEEIVNDPESAKEFLRNLYDAGILKKELYDKVLHCPKCGSVNISIHYCCPKCGSFNIKKTSLIEHIKCGYIDSEESFQTGDKLICPKCHGKLSKIDVDYVKAGTWCNCTECGKSFDIPSPSHFCRGCHQIFTFEEAVYEDAYIYSLREDVTQNVHWGLTTLITKFLQNCGFEVESPGLLDGKSGLSHVFDVVARRRLGTNPNVIVIDLATASDKNVSQDFVTAMFGKVYDSTPNKAFLIAVPKLEDNAKRLTGQYNIKLIEAKNHDDIMSALKALIT